MNIKLNVLLSLITGNLLVRDKEWDDLMAAEDFLLSKLEYLDVDESELISSYLIECFPEIMCIKELIAHGEDPLTTSQFIAKLPKTYNINPIPADYEIKKVTKDKQKSY